MYWFSPPKQKPSAVARRRHARMPDTCKVGGGGYSGGTPQGRSETVPTLRLRGRWLQELGFDVGTTLSISHGQGEITLKVIKQ